MFSTLVQHQAGGAVGAGGEFLVEHIEALGVGAEELHLGDEVAGVGLLLALLLDEPVEELHGAEVLHFVGGVIDGMDAGGDILLVLQAGFQHIHVFLVFLVGHGDGVQLDWAVVVLHILVDEHGVVTLLLGLDHVPIGEAGKAALVEVVVHVQIKIGAVELLVDLLVEQVGNFFIQHNYCLIWGLIFKMQKYNYFFVRQKIFASIHQFEVGFAVLAPGTDEVVGHLVALIDVATYLADPALFADH